MQARPTDEGVPTATKESAAMNGDSMQHLPVDEKKESPSADGYTPSEMPSMHGVPQMMNGMPPSQVYVDTTVMAYHGMTSFETQFQALGVHDVHDSSNHESSEGNDASGEGSNEEDTVKLFIGQVSIQESQCWILKIHGRYVPCAKQDTFIRSQPDNRTCSLLSCRHPGSSSNE
jgi:hypothetical protein